MKSYFMCVVISTPVLIMYLLGTVKFIFDHEGNSCEMTYMFEYPEYVHIPLQEEIQQQYPRYGLYAYGEGFTVSRIRAMHFSGIPVLFIPGNAGSHHQEHWSYSQIEIFSRNTNIHCKDKEQYREP